MSTLKPMNCEHEDFSLILEQLPKLIAFIHKGLKRKGFNPSLERTKNELHQALAGKTTWLALYQAGPCLVSLYVDYPWWSATPHLGEDFIIRYKDGDIKDTYDAIEAYAKEQGCSSVLLGDLASPRPSFYQRTVESLGYKHTLNAYHKEIK